MATIITKTNYKFDYELVKRDVMRILEENNFLPQIGLTHSDRAKTDEEKILDSTGSIFNYEDRTYKFSEKDFSIFNEAYKNTYLYEIYKQIPNLGRFRIMSMDGPKCYTIHRDLSMRYHYVITTNANCLFLFPGVKSQFYIPADGNLYLLDTRYKHTFVNGSKEKRIHLVMDDLSTLVNAAKIEDL